MLAWGPITEEVACRSLRDALEPLKGTPVHYLQLPVEVAPEIEPSQIGTIVGTLTDLMLPRIAMEKGIGLKKTPGLLGDREGYPDFQHDSNYRVELKGVFTDNPSVRLKKPPTPREPSARLTQKVTVKNVDPDADALLLLVYRLEPLAFDPSLLSPTITAVGVFPVIKCTEARDMRMLANGGLWFGDFDTPTILSKAGRKLFAVGSELNAERYGRKESEGWHFNEDTNFGKMKRIPYRPLQEFLRDSGCKFSAKGIYPEPWSMSKEDQKLALALEEASKGGTDT